MDSSVISIYSQSVQSFDNEYNNYINEESQPNLHLEIERSRITDILNESVNNICIVMFLDTFIDNADTWIKPYFSSEEMNIISKGFFYNTIQLSSLVAFENKIRPADTSLYDALYIFCKNPHIIRLAESMMNDLQNKIASTKYEIFTAFKQLSEFFINRVHIRADEERRNAEYLVNIWDKNEAAKKKIIVLQRTLDKKRSNYEQIKDVKQQYISKHEEIIENTNLQCEQQILKHTMIAERRMADDWLASVEKQRELKELCKQIHNEMETLVANHVYVEKQSRAKRLKIEMQLLSWVKKYDDEMGERQDRFDVLLKQYEDEKFLLNEMTKKFEEQEQIYTELMNEKNEYLHNTWLEKVNHFIRTIAARHIQRWYRRILKTTAARKRAAIRAQKKGKKGKSSAKSETVKSAPPVITSTNQKNVVEPQLLSKDPSIDSRRTSMSSRRASTVPLGVTKIQTEPREINVDENGVEENQDDKKLSKFGYVSTFFKSPTEEDSYNQNDNVDLF